MSAGADCMAPLRGMGVLVTRAAHQAERLIRLIEAEGGTVIRFPTVEILDPRDPAAVLAVIERLEDHDMAIFTSANAVGRAMPLIQARGGLPCPLKLIAIGKGSARELERFGVSVDLVPDSAFSSETLLAMPALQAVAGLRIVIFRGEGGRTLLGDTLRRRGARVTFAEVYRRDRPAADPNGLIQHWARGKIQVAIVTSNENLRNLFEIVGELGQQWLRDTALIVVSPRALQLAQQLGFRHPPLLAREASDEAIVEQLLTMAPNPIRVTFGDRNDG